MSKKVANVLFVIGLVLVFGAIGYDDTMMISGQNYPLIITVRNILFGCLFFIPRLVYGKKFS